MRHPTEGVIRRLLDDPAGVSEPDRDHVAGCEPCLGALATMRDDARIVELALTIDDPAGDVGSDVDAALTRLHRALPAAPALAPVHDMATERAARSSRFRETVRRPAVVALAAAVVLAGASTAAANNWFQIFQAEKVAPIIFSAADLNALPDLRAYGDVEVSGEPDVHDVAGPQEAAAESGLDVPDVTHVPRGVRGEPTYQVGDQVTATFTFSSERAARAARAAGQELPPPPPGLDGSQVRMVAGPGLVAVWTQRAGLPSLAVGRAVAPKAFSTGVPFETVRDYLLTLPGMPENVAAQLRTFASDGSTLPLPVPPDTTSSATVNGAPATVLVARDRSLAAVVWVDDGLVTAVAGPLDVDEVLEVARGVR